MEKQWVGLLGPLALKTPPPSPSVRISLWSRERLRGYSPGGPQIPLTENPIIQRAAGAFEADASVISTHDFDFIDLDRFSVEYHRLFGESP